jgi:hypothetical protein
MARKLQGDQNLYLDKDLVMDDYNWLSGISSRMIEVHHFKVLDPETGKWVVPPHKCSAETISKVKGQILGGTTEMVARSSVDKDGCYDAKQPRKKPA